MRAIIALLLCLLAQASIFGPEREEAEIVIKDARVRVPISELHTSEEHVHSASEEIGERLAHLRDQLKETISGHNAADSAASLKMNTEIAVFVARAKELLNSPMSSAAERYHAVNDYVDALREKIASDAAEAGLDAQAYLDSFQHSLVKSGTFSAWSRVRDAASAEIDRLSATAAQLRSVLAPSTDSGYSTPLVQQIAHLRDTLFRTHKDESISERLSDIMHDLRQRVAPGSQSSSLPESVRNKIAKASEYVNQKAEAMRLALSPPQPTGWERLQTFVASNLPSRSAEPRPTFSERVGGKIDDVKAKLHDAVDHAKLRVAAASMKERLRDQLHYSVDQIIDAMPEEELTAEASNSRLRVLVETLRDVLKRE